MTNDRDYLEPNHPREKSLPLWAREWLDKLRMDLMNTEDELARTRVAHALTAERRGWFTIPGPSADLASLEVYNLWYLERNGAHAACSLRHGDVLLVGRAVEEA